MSPELAGRVALVTGGGGGLGRATAVALARAGCDVAVVGRTRAALETAAMAVARLGRRSLHVVADVTGRDDVERAVAAVGAALGPVGVLVYAAGIAESSAIVPPDDALFDRTMAVNVRGAWLCLTACLPGMRAARFGRVVHVASTAALEGSRYTAAYVASKHALLGLTRAAARDVARDGITVNAVCPGFLDTPMTERTLARITAATGRERDVALADVLSGAGQRALIAPAAVADAIVALAADPTKTGTHVEIRG